MMEAKKFFTEQFTHYQYYASRILLNDYDTSKFIFSMYFKNPYADVVITNLTKEDRDSLVAFIKSLDCDVTVLTGSFW